MPPSHMAESCWNSPSKFASWSGLQFRLALHHSCSKTSSEVGRYSSWQSRPLSRPVIRTRGVELDVRY